MDGTLGSRTARLLDGSGVAVTGRAEFEEIVARAARDDLAVAVHAIGDLAVREALDAFEATAALWRPRGLRQRIEHAQCVAREDLARFAALDVTASVQPAMLVSDRELAERLWAERLDGAYAYASLRRAGARLAGGSDAPVEDLSPLDGMRAAVLRDWRPQERLPAEAALAAWTAAPAWLAGEEAVRGRLGPGMLADLVVLDRDPLAGDDELREARVLATMSGGRWLRGAP
jgi:predicted amidohydrolase YtcJ